MFIDTWVQYIYKRLVKAWTGATLSYPLGHRAKRHVHGMPQLFFVISGLLNIRTAKGSWVVPPGRLGCIKGGVAHSALTLSALEAWSVFLPVQSKRAFPEDVSILRSSRLLESLLERVAKKKPLNFRDPVDKSFATLVLSEITRAESEPLGIPIPTSQSLMRVTQSILAKGSEGKPVKTWAKEAGMSPRSFSRHFRAETGLTFERWRTLANHQKAIELMSNGESVTTVAFTLGYESVSAFIASFRTLHGSSPLKFLKGFRDRA